MKQKQKDAHFENQDAKMSQVSASLWEKNIVKKQNKREKLHKKGLHWGKDNFSQ